MANGQPVEGIHYIRSDDDSMLESEPTDAEGKVNPRLPDNTESAQIIFAVGPITRATVRNGIREFDFDTENGGFRNRPRVASDFGVGVASIYSAGVCWSALKTIANVILTF